MIIASGEDIRKKLQLYIAKIVVFLGLLRLIVQAAPVVPVFLSLGLRLVQSEFFLVARISPYIILAFILIRIVIEPTCLIVFLLLC